ncbi:hypothetical protein ElyMa_001491300 [Elysia marginata]|uniref:Cytohesin Ubiquitin Protein Inducing domain-containing protein n=1 Tax=Elysia marginata TaxID=1093978 RepID=A0AAV4J2Z0_9GAST|nr:hypothetical protein ElyMa_001491300 [Elysia marginata]
MTTDEKGYDSLIQSPCWRPEFPKQEHQTEAGPMESSKRYNRSLNELPGYLRVPVLRRKDTERTQARLEAGVAGLAELRLLKEKQMALVEQTVTASIKQRHKPQRKLTKSTENLDSHVPSIKYEDGKMTPEQVKHEPRQPWRSTTSLSSITEETSRARGGDRSMVGILQGGGLCLRSSAWSPRSHQKTLHRGNRERSPTHNDQRLVPRQDRRQSSQGVNDEYKETNLNKEYAGRSCVDQPRTETVRGQTYLQRKHDENCEPNFDDSHAKHYSKEPTYSQGAILSPQYRDHIQKCSLAQTHRSNHKRSASVDMPLVSKIAPNMQKRMSWDNLLVLAGLQTKNFDPEDPEKDDTLSQSLNTPNDTHANAPPSVSTDHCTEISFNSDDIYSRVKKGRSHSFCCDNGSSFRTTGFVNSHRSNETLDKMDTESKDLVSNDQDEDVFENDSEAEKAKAIIRRASIQCETVLTGGRIRNRKIFNPLHEIDVVALRSPGPLHAVTLQYKSIPLNALPDNVENIPLRGRSASVCYGDLSTVNNNDRTNANTWEEKSSTGNLLQMQKANKNAKQLVRHSLQPILENGNKAQFGTFVKPQRDNINPNAHLKVQAESFINERSCKSLSELETKANPDDCFSNKLHFDENKSNIEVDLTESKNVNEKMCPSTRGSNSFDPPLSLHEINPQEKPVLYVPSRKDSDYETFINCPPPWPPQMTAQPDPTTSISSSKSQATDLCPQPLLPDTGGAQPQHTPDESLILYDDGYSTCDSLSPHSRLSIGPSNSSSSSSSTSDWSSLSSGSVSNVSIASAFSPSSGVSAFRRAPGFRHLRYSHPPNMPRTGSGLKTRSCSVMNSPCSTLSHVPEVSNSETAHPKSLYQDEPCSPKETGGNRVTDSLSHNQKEQQIFNSEMVFTLHEPVQNSDSVFSDGILVPSPVNLYANYDDCSSQVEYLNQSENATAVERADQSVSKYALGSNNTSKPSNSLEHVENNYALLEKGTVIQLNPSETTKASSSEEPQDASILHTKLNSYRVRMTPNKNVRQTAV